MTALENHLDGKVDPVLDSLLVEGRGSRMVFPNGTMQIALLSASANGQPVRFPSLNDTLHVIRREQVDSASTSLPLSGVGMLELKILYRSSGVVPAAVQFGIEVRDANSGSLLGKLRTFSSVGDSIVTLRTPLNFPGRSVTLGIRGNNMSGVREFTLERWFLVPEDREGQIALNPEGVEQTLIQGKEIPSVFALHPNHPNPFNPTTHIRFDLPEASNVSLVVYDILGRQVAELASGEFEAGYHSVTWNASSFASGIYLARFAARQIDVGQATDATGALRLSTTQKLLLTK